MFLEKNLCEKNALLGGLPGLMTGYLGTTDFFNNVWGTSSL